MNNELIELMGKAINCEGSCKFAVGEINGHEVEAQVVHQFRMTTRRSVRKPSIMWKVDGKRVAAANLSDALA